MTLTRRYRFAASHRLHTSRLTDEENKRVYGKCNNPYGHGHDYVLEVTVRGLVDEQTGRVVDRARLDDLVHCRVLADFDHRNMNTQIRAFADKAPTTENVALEIERRLRNDWPQLFPEGAPRLDRIRLYETRKNVIELVSN